MKFIISPTYNYSLNIDYSSIEYHKIHSCYTTWIQIVMILPSFKKKTIFTLKLSAAPKYNYSSNNNTERKRKCLCWLFFSVGRTQHWCYITFQCWQRTQKSHEAQLVQIITHTHTSHLLFFKVFTGLFCCWSYFFLTKTIFICSMLCNMYFHADLKRQWF